MSNEQFIRCPYCRRPHAADVLVCPQTGDSLARGPGRRSSTPGDAPDPTQKQHRPATSADDLVDALVGGKYVVTGLIGRGGMATVYEAQQLSVNRAVAIKVLHIQDAKGSTTLKRFHQEARVAAQLPHANICQVFDFGELPDKSPYIVMERLSGESLADRITREQQVSVPFTIEVAWQVLNALSVAHKQGVLHRDIKPENIYLSKSGRNTVVKLLDFGLSKVVVKRTKPDEPGASQLTRAGITMGTPYYMAPEQAYGDRDLDERVDIWALGVTMFEALTGQRPFVGETKYVLMKSIVTDAHKPLLSLRPDAPPAMEGILAKALAKDRAARYQNAAAFQRDLAAVVNRKA